MRQLFIAACLAVTAIIAVIGGGPGCRTPPPPPPPPPPTPAPFYSLCVEASPRLNWYDQSAHTLFVRIFQLSSLEGFAQAEAGGLLDSQSTPPGLVGTPIEKTLYPGKKITIDVPVRQEAEFLGTVAGYYRLDGSAKAHRQLRRSGVPEPCMKLGPNAIEAP